MKFSRIIKIIRGNKVTRTLAYPLDLICHHVLARITAAHPYRYPAHNHKWVYGRRMDWRIRYHYMKKYIGCYIVQIRQYGQN